MKIRQLTLSKTALNTYTLFFANTLDAFFAFLFTVLAFRLLDTAQFGILSALNNFIVVMFSILDLGISSGLVNFVSYYSGQNQPSTAKKYLKAGLIFRTSVSALAVLVIASLSWYLAPKAFLIRSPLPVIFASVAILGLSLVDVINFSLQAYQKFFSSALVSFSFSLIRFLGIFIVFFLQIPFTVAIAMIITSMAPVVSVILGIKFLKPPFSGFNPDKEIYRRLISFSKWIGVNKIASTIASRLDIQLILLLAGASTAGLYSVAARIASFYSVIVASFSAVLGPKFASGKNIRQLKPFVAKATLAVVGLLSLMVIGILVAKPFILLLFGEKAIDSVLPFQALTLAFMPFVANSITIPLIIYAFKKTSIVGFLSILQAITTVIGHLILIPRFGILGPAISIGIVNLLIFSLSLVSVIILWKNDLKKN